MEDGKVDKCAYFETYLRPQNKTPLMEQSPEVNTVRQGMKTIRQGSYKPAVDI